MPSNEPFISTEILCSAFGDRSRGVIYNWFHIQFFVAIGKGGYFVVRIIDQKGQERKAENPCQSGSVLLVANTQSSACHSGVQRVNLTLHSEPLALILETNELVSLSFLVM